MSDKIIIKKGLDIPLKGKAAQVLVEMPRSDIYTIKPTDFHGIIPKLKVRVGDRVKAGDILFFSKADDKVQFAAPVSGTVEGITRKERRRIVEVRIKPDEEIEYKEFGVKKPEDMSREDIIDHLSVSGCLPYFIQRPYDVIANSKDIPKAIFVSAFSSAPLAPDRSFSMKGMEEDFYTGIRVLNKLTGGKVHLSVKGDDDSFFTRTEGVVLHRIYGKHPAGNVGVQIEKIDPINAGDRIWTIQPEDIALIGRLFNTGKYDATRVIAFAGSEVEEPKYLKTIQGVRIQHLFDKCVLSPVQEVRIINGDVLTGEIVHKNGFLGFYNNLISVIPEGKHYTFFGWLPFTQNRIFSLSRTFLSRWFPKKEYVLDTNYNGEERAFVMTEELEEVFPMDIYPVQLLKACLVKDIEKMEKLGIYEVAPEDFGLIDYVSSSKIEAQSIIREALDLMIKEVG